MRKPTRGAVFGPILGLVFSAGVCAEDGRIQLSQMDFSDDPYTYTIAAPGSYVFTEDITAVKEGFDGIVVVADDVAIDLNGFTFSGTGSLSGSGIVQAESNRNLVVRNGQLADWGSADEYGIAAMGVGSRVTGVKVFGCGTGIRVGNAGLVADCHAASNDLYGIYAGHGGLISRCVALHNGSHGIRAVGRSVVAGCTSVSNATYGIHTGEGSAVGACAVFGNASHGLRVEDGTAVHGCTATANSGASADGVYGQLGVVVKACASEGNGDDGFYGNLGCLFADCTSTRNGDQGFYVQSGVAIRESAASGNAENGIWMVGDSLVAGNVCASNAFAGVYTAGNGSYIRGNHLAGNTRGVDLDSSTNLVVQNSVVWNTQTNFSVSAGNIIGSRTVSSISPYETSNFDIP